MKYLHHLTNFSIYAGFAVFGLLALLLLGSLLPIPGGYQVRVVESGSMEPAIPTGAAIIVRPAESYQVGDVVTFQRRGEAAATTHRIIASEEAGFITQGDANNTADMTPVRPVEIVGKSILAVPFLGYVLAFAKQPVGFALLVGLPAAFIVYEQILRIRTAILATAATKEADTTNTIS